MEISAAERFKVNCLELVEFITDEIISDDVKMKSKKIYFYLSSLSANFVIRKYIDRTQKLWIDITSNDPRKKKSKSLDTMEDVNLERKKNLTFFESNIKAMFMGIPQENIDEFGNEIKMIIKRDGTILEDIWTYMISLINICKTYIKETGYKSMTSLTVT